MSDPQLETTILLTVVQDIRIDNLPDDIAVKIVEPFVVVLVEDPSVFPASPPGFNLLLTIPTGSLGMG